MLDDGQNKNYIMKLDTNMDTIASQIYYDVDYQSTMFTDCIITKDNTRLLAFIEEAPTTTVSFVDMYVYDTSLNFLYYKNFPYKLNYVTGGIDVQYQHNLTAKWVTDSTFIVGCNHERYFGQGYSERDVGISELDTTLSLKPVYYFGGSGDTIDYAPQLGGTIDFSSPDSILFAGTKNQINDFFPQQPSFIMAGMVDRNLQPRFIQFYGGDAYYSTTVMKRAKNGGFIITAQRYDYQTQNQEYDVVLLKLNPQGLITETSESDVMPHYGFTLYPNPVNDKLTVNLSAQKAELAIYDMKGTIVKQRSIVKGENYIDTKTLIPGTYVCEVITGEKLKLVQKFQKTK